ncbi:hypothetical protein EZJ43_05580 [Pedobacter changchengzhani]|uniref:Late embryogenesis abundant protein LEA-2 subgroup domain-containing protein n=1 Tax=Pedobacter changchengzhani TaxID=2529274 RepID=A0A4R5MMK9_9SPHI|nr:hypothetical protein [Pedobacter changchengzhani]TDG36756.1 hypothetical protein EZJ43_05580 [Pedobacter changchengzhani]
MKQILSLCIIILLFAGCDIAKQAQQVAALESCTYRLTKLQQVSLAGTDVQKLLNQQDLSLSSLPGIALGLLRKDIPLRANLNLEITNPTAQLAAINQFEYKILVNNTELTEGIINQNVNVAQGQTVNVPVQMSTNIYGLLAGGNLLNDIMKATKTGTANDKIGVLTLKIKPSIMIGGTLVKYPGYITINKDISSKILF